MPLILAIDRDRRQGAALADLVRTRLRAELCQARSAADALAELNGRIPDLVLTSPLLSARDEDLIATHLRDLASAAGHVQTVRIPLLASSHSATGVGGMLARLGLNRNAAPPADACDPDVFAEEIAQYLARSAEERQTQATAGGQTGTDIPADSCHVADGNPTCDHIEEQHGTPPGDFDDAGTGSLLRPVSPLDALGRESIHPDAPEPMETAREQQKIQSDDQPIEAGAVPVEETTAPALLPSFDDGARPLSDNAESTAVVTTSAVNAGDRVDAQEEEPPVATADPIAERARTAAPRPVDAHGARAEPEADSERLAMLDGIWEEQADWQVRPPAVAAGSPKDEILLPPVSEALLLDEDGSAERQPHLTTTGASVELEEPIAFDACAFLMADAPEAEPTQGGAVIAQRIQAPATRLGTSTTTVTSTPRMASKAAVSAPPDDSRDDYVEVDLTDALDAPHEKPAAHVSAVATPAAAERNGTRPPGDSAASGTRRSSNPARQSDEEWGMYDPAQCGFPALINKLDEVTGQRNGNSGSSGVKTLTH